MRTNQRAALACCVLCLILLYVASYFSDPIVGVNAPGSVPREEKLIALTFDDGPTPSATDRILDVLEQYNARATFFVLGENAQMYPEILQRMADLDCEIGNHTYSHKDISLLSQEALVAEISATDKAIREATGSSPSLFRPPYGICSEDSRQQIDKPIILWTLDTQDRDHRNSQQTIENVLSQVSNGSVILLSDLYDTTAQAIEKLIPELQEAGYTLVTISELCKAKGISLEKGELVEFLNP